MKLTPPVTNGIKQLEVLHYLIHGNQKGFLHDRFIGENTRVIYDVIHNTFEKRTPGIILLIDFERHLTLFHETFRFILNFGSDLLKWVQYYITNLNSVF